MLNLIRANGLPILTAFSLFGMVLVCGSLALWGKGLETDLAKARGETAACQAQVKAADDLAKVRAEAAAKAIEAAKKQSARDQRIATEILTIPAPAEPNALPSIIDLIESERKDSTK